MMLPASAPSIARRCLGAIEPWYDWGQTFISRIDDESDGPGRFFELQWLGFNITVFFGRTPQKGSH